MTRTHGIACLVRQHHPRKNRPMEPSHPARVKPPEHPIPQTRKKGSMPSPKGKLCMRQQQVRSNAPAGDTSNEKREGATVRATSPPAGTIGGNNMHKGQNAPSNAASAGKKTETCCRRGARGSQHSHRPNPTFVRRPFNRRSSTCAQGKGTAPRSHPCTDKATTSSTLARS